MNDYLELIKILGPAILIIYVVYLVVRSFLDKQLEELRINLQSKNQDVVMPIRLQAYERIVLFLERISINRLVTRLNNGKYTSKEFQQIMVAEIRQEINHNLSQQVYMSDEAWTFVSTAVEDTISMINDAAYGLDEKSTGLDLVKRLFETTLEKEKNSVQVALSFVKDEIRSIF